MNEGKNLDSITQGSKVWDHAIKGTCVATQMTTLIPTDSDKILVLDNSMNNKYSFNITKYVSGEMKKCPFCNLPWKNCNTHRVFLKLPILYIYPMYLPLMIAFLNGICISYNAHTQEFSGCLKPRVLNFDIAPSRKKMASGKNRKTCNMNHPRGFKQKENITDYRFDKPAIKSRDMPETGSLVYREHAKGKLSEPVYIPLDVLKKFFINNREALADAYRVYDIGLFFENVITDKLSLLPIQSRPSIAGTHDNRTQEYLKICGKAQVCGSRGGPLTDAYTKACNDGIQYRGSPLSELICAVLNISGGVKKDAQTSQKSTWDSITGKFGLARELTAKQSENCGRTVVGSSNSKFCEYDVPYYYEDMPRGELVNRYNKNVLEEVGRLGAIIYVYKANLKKFIYWDATNGVLECGDQVFRFIVGGDIILANRQPTLHKQSFMSHFLKFVYGATVRLTSAPTLPYNCDFDGDEISISAPLSLESAMEAETFMFCGNCIIAGVKPIMGPVFHELTALYYMSLRALEQEELGERLEPWQSEKFMENYEKVRDWRERLATFKLRRLFIRKVPLDRPELDTFADVLSLLFPADFYYKDIVACGIFKTGKGSELVKEIIGTRKNSIVHRIHAQYLNKRCAMFIADCSAISKTCMRIFPLSLPLKDFGHGDKDVQRTILRHGASISAEIEILQSKIDSTHSSIEKAQLENELYKYIEKGITFVSTMVSGMKTDTSNCLQMLIKSGARGNALSYTQITAVLGQQTCSGGRVDASKATCFSREQRKGAIAHGFIGGSNYAKGLQPEEMIPHSIFVRSAIVDSNLQVAKAGDLSNRMIQCLSSVKVLDDFRLNMGKVAVTFSPGSFMNPQSLIEVTIKGKRYASFIDIGAVVSQINSEYDLVNFKQACDEKSKPVINKVFGKMRRGF
jgi:DNA-directed RNA polymerase beta' subunit